MNKFFSNKAAWKEAITDTSIGFVINFPINVVMLYICKLLDVTVFMTSIILSVVFTAVAIIRKYTVRIFFNKTS